MYVYMKPATGQRHFEGAGMRFRTAAVIANIELEYRNFTDITGLGRQGCVGPYRRRKAEEIDSAHLFR
jgi:hypothetical protein